MLCGSAEAVASAVTTWLELLVAQLQHLYPDLQLLPHLTTLLQRCLQEKGALDDWLPHTVQDLLEVTSGSSTPPKTCWKFSLSHPHHPRTAGGIHWLLHTIQDLLEVNTVSCTQFKICWK